MSSEDPTVARRWIANPVGRQGRNNPMRSNLMPVASAVFIALIAIAAAPNAAMARESIVASKPLPAPVGHAQPTPNGFLSDEDANADEQQRLSKFDAQQHLLDEQLDKSLNICRC
ncbi:hypothetical protein [Tardiphaga sp. 42S5]|uniref:hypothetical protein n=1 Tax=Tardiphaga sp. 42S5 TaxID=1404799 RepID=UPI002A59FB0D|nr:hypothetical protein [Tardiphaga sp. 42S5]WPO41244.1 hypothetical protein SFY93_27640 [Tardiphaga sp. 42S5]